MRMERKDLTNGGRGEKSLSHLGIVWMTMGLLIYLTFAVPCMQKSVGFYFDFFSKRGLNTKGVEISAACIFW